MRWAQFLFPVLVLLSGLATSGCSVENERQVLKVKRVGSLEDLGEYLAPSPTPRKQDSVSNVGNVGNAEATSDATGVASSDPTLDVAPNEPTPDAVTTPNDPVLPGVVVGYGTTTSVFGFRSAEISLSAPQAEDIAVVFVRPSDGALLVIGQSGFVFVSTNNGSSWTPVCRVPSTPAQGHLVSSEAFGSVVAVVEGRLAVLDEPVENRGPCRTLGFPEGKALSSVALSKERLVAGSGFAFFTSTNKGASWTPVSLGEPVPVPWVGRGLFPVLHPAEPARLTLFSCERIASGRVALVLRSRQSDTEPLAKRDTNQGCANLDLLVFDAKAPNTLYSDYRPLTGDAFQTSDGGATWTKAGDAKGWIPLVPVGGFAKFVPRSSSNIVELFVSPSESPSTFALRGSLPFRGEVTAAHGKERYLVKAAKSLFASFDGGATFVSIEGPRGNTPAASLIASHDGVNLFATNSSYSVFRSANAGVTWQKVYEPAASVALPNNRGLSPRIYINPAASGSAVLHAETFNSAFNSFRVATVDGFATADAREDESVYGWASAIGYLSSDAGNHYSMGNNKLWRASATSAPGVVLSPTSAFVWSPFPDLLSFAGAPNRLFVGAMGFGSQNRYESIDMTTFVVRDLRSALNVVVAGHAIAQTPAGARLRVISATGEIMESANGEVFAALGSSPGFVSCDRRLLKVSAANPAHMATACLLQSASDLAFTKDAGATWTRSPAVTGAVSSRDSEVSGCLVTDLVVALSRIYVSCDRGRALVKEY